MHIYKHRKLAKSTLANIIKQLTRTIELLSPEGAWTPEGMPFHVCKALDQATKDAGLDDHNGTPCYITAQRFILRHILILKAEKDEFYRKYRHRDHFNVVQWEQLTPGLTQKKVLTVLRKALAEAKRQYNS